MKDNQQKETENVISSPMPMHIEDTGLGFLYSMFANANANSEPPHTNKLDHPFVGMNELCSFHDLTRWKEESFIS